MYGVYQKENVFLYYAPLPTIGQFRKTIIFAMQNETDITFCLSW